MAGRFLLALLAAVAVLAAPAGAATINVTTPDDELTTDGDCSLREAFHSANKNISRDDCPKGESARDTIKLKDETYDLDIPTTHEGLNADGDLDYTGGGKLTVIGKGTGVVASRVSAFGNQDRAIDMPGGGPGLSLTLAALEVAGGDVTAQDGNEADGGGVRVEEGSLTLRRVDVFFGDGDSGGGVAFRGSGALRLTRATIDSNDAISSGGGLYAFDQDAEATVRRSEFTDNDLAGGNGFGGGAFLAIGPASVTDTLFDDNDASGAPGGAGAGLMVFTPDVQVRRSLFTRNDASGGAAAGAGGIDAQYPTKVTNATFYDNSTTGDGAAVRGVGVLSHVTFLSNEADDEGDHVSNYQSESDLVLRNSILPGASIVVDVCSTELSGEVISKGYNVASYDDPDCSFLDSDVVGDAALVPGGPTDNGGPTETIAIEGSSVAKNLVPISKCKVAGGEDQRGFERPRGPGCDAGAFELGATP